MPPKKKQKTETIFHDQVAALHEQQRIMIDYLHHLQSSLRQSKLTKDTHKTASFQSQIKDVETQLNNIIDEERALRKHQTIVDRKGNTCWNNVLVLDKVFTFIGDGSPNYQVAMLCRVSQAFRETAQEHASFWSVLDTTNWSNTVLKSAQLFHDALVRFATAHGSICKTIVIANLNMNYGISIVKQQSDERQRVAALAQMRSNPPPRGRLARRNRKQRKKSTTWVCNKCPGSIRMAQSRSHCVICGKKKGWYKYTMVTYTGGTVTRRTYSSDPSEESESTVVSSSSSSSSSSFSSSLVRNEPTTVQGKQTLVTNGLKTLFDKCTRVTSITLDEHNKQWCTLAILKLLIPRMTPTRINQEKFVLTNLSLLRLSSIEAKDFRDFCQSAVESVQPTLYPVTSAESALSSSSSSSARWSSASSSSASSSSASSSSASSSSASSSSASSSSASSSRSSRLASSSSSDQHYVLPNGRLRICGTKFDPRPILSTEAFKSAFSTLIDLDCSPDLLEFKTYLMGEIHRRRLTNTTANIQRTAWMTTGAVSHLSMARLQRITFFKVPRISMSGMNNILDHCHSLVSLSLAGTRLSHSCLLTAVTKKVGARLEVLNLCGTLQLNTKLLNEIGFRCPQLRLLNIAACCVTQVAMDSWISSPYNLPTKLLGINISCNPDLRSAITHTIASIAGAFPKLEYLTYVASCELNTSHRRVKSFLQRLRNSLHDALGDGSSLRVICCPNDIGTHEFKPYNTAKRPPLSAALQIDDLISTLLMSVNAISRRESIFGFNIGNADSDEDMDDDVQGFAGHHNVVAHVDAPPPVQVHQNFQHNAVFGHLNPPPQANHVNHQQQLQNFAALVNPTGTNAGANANAGANQPNPPPHLAPLNVPQAAQPPPLPANPMHPAHQAHHAHHAHHAHQAHQIHLVHPAQTAVPVIPQTADAPDEPERNLTNVAYTSNQVFYLLPVHTGKKTIVAPTAEDLQQRSAVSRLGTLSGMKSSGSY